MTKNCNKLYKQHEKELVTVFLQPKINIYS